MNIQLHALEARVIGCLIEKEITTPDQYPLSLNALLNACNQKSNREPMLNLDERTVQGIVDGLKGRHLILERSGFGSRVAKYQHRFCNTDFGPLKFSPLELAILCELMLRGPQTPGELRTRASRMTSIASTEAVEQALTGLAARDDGAYVLRLPREPGRRDCCWTHLFCAAPLAASAASSVPADKLANVEDNGRSLQSIDSASGSQLEARLAQLEAQVDRLTQRLNALEARREV